jgi:hypothetical protein
MTTESLLPLPIPMIGPQFVLLVTKDLMLVPHVLDLFSKTVLAAKLDGSKTDPTAVSNVIPSVQLVLDPRTISAQNVLEDSTSIKAQLVLLPAQKDSSARSTPITNRFVINVLLASRNVPPLLKLRSVTEDSN